MGCSAKWKREVVPDHKFDFINVQEYRTNALSVRLKYIWLWITLLITLGVHCANIYTAITYLLAKDWTNSIYKKCQEVDDCVVKISFTLCKWIFVGCIIFSFLLLFYEAWKCRKVILSRDIAYGFTNIQANHYYSIRSYPHFCFFNQISASTKRADDFAFFVFFTFKGWKEILIADAPRQVVNAITLFSFGKVNQWQTDDLTKYYDGNWVTLLLLLAMIYTVAIFAVSFVLLLAAAVFYLPLLCHIKGNLKEYCCHKVDKRIAELMVRKRNQRVKLNAAYEKRLAATGGMNSKGFATQMPTLPQISMDDSDSDSVGLRDRAAPIDGVSVYGGNGGMKRSHSGLETTYPPQPPIGKFYNGQRFDSTPYGSDLARRPSYPPPSQAGYGGGELSYGSHLHAGGGGGPTLMSYPSSSSDLHDYPPPLSTDLYSNAAPSAYPPTAYPNQSSSSFIDAPYYAHPPPPPRSTSNLSLGQQPYSSTTALISPSEYSSGGREEPPRWDDPTGYSHPPPRSSSTQTPPPPSSGWANEKAHYR